MRYLSTETVPLDTLTRYPGNPRRGVVEEIRESIRVNGHYKPLTVRVHGGLRTILVGNHTSIALAEEGYAEARVEFIDCTDDEARRIVLVDNKVGASSTYDDADLLEMLRDVDTAGGLMGTGWQSAEYEALLSIEAATESRLAGYTGTENPYDEDLRPPDAFPSVGHDIDTAYRCPSCSYEWSGKAK